MTLSVAGRRFEAWVAESFTARLLGLAFSAPPPPGRALLIPRCRAVHTWGMRFAIDIAFLSWPGCGVLDVRLDVAARRVASQTGLRAGAVAVLEAPAGGLAALAGARGGSVTVIAWP